MNQDFKIFLKTTFKPIYSHLYIPFQKFYFQKHQAQLAEKLYNRATGRQINWNNPKDLNEKINWLKFHWDLKEWAKLADKYAVREYVIEKGLEDILVPLYGKWNSVDEVIKALDNLPEEFILKSNNGCGFIHRVSKVDGGKGNLNKGMLRKELQEWLDTKNYGFDGAEPHYSLIQNCIIAEKLLHDDSVKSFSCSIVDYKIWCFDGKPYGCFIAYDRGNADHGTFFDFYDLDWNQRTDFMTDSTPKHLITKPKNWEQMLKYASILSEGHPEVRVDFYNIDGEIYFGELTFTSLGGYMTYFTEEQLEVMGNLVPIDLSLKPNEWFH